MPAVKIIITLLIITIFMFTIESLFAVENNIIWDLQAVDADGIATHPKAATPTYWVPNTPGNLLIFEGISLASKGELDNPDGPGFQWLSIWIQSEADKGGIQVFSGMWLKSLFWSSYPDVQAGDRVRITGWAAFHNGKTFINDRHDETGSTMWSVQIISHGAMPEPEVIPSIFDCNYFDPTRINGGERWQTRWVRLRNIEISSGTWTDGSEITISDGTGVLIMKLADTSDFSQHAAPTGKFDIVGLFDQEDLDSPFHDNYRIWIKKYADFSPPTPELIIRQGISPDSVELQWVSSSGTIYKIMESTDMLLWTQIGNDISGDNTTKNIVVTPHLNPNYYRLEAQLE